MTNWLARLKERFAPRLRIPAPSPDCNSSQQQIAAGAPREFSRGLELLDAGRHADAVACFEAAVEQVHDFADAHYCLGLAHHRLGRFEDACDAFTLAVCFSPRMARAYLALAWSQRKKGDRAAALESTERGIEIDQGMTEAYKLRGALLFESGNVTEAIASFEQAVKVDPADVGAHTSLGYLLFNHRADYERGAWHLQRAIQIDPTDLSAQGNYTMVLLARGDLEATVRLCDRLLATQPDLHEARLNRGIALLKMARFDVAWEDYEARKKVPGYGIASPLPHPELQASADATGRTVVVQCEQGLGDEIMFASCFDDIVRRAARCIILCSHRLEPLFARSFRAATVTSSYASLSEAQRRPIDYRIAAGSLPRLFRRSLADFPKHRGYLEPDASLAKAWRQKLAALGPGLKVGLSWQGGVVTTRRVHRSIPLQDLTPLLELPDCHFVDLQYGDTLAERSNVERVTGCRLHHWREAIEDCDQCAALISSLDLVISVCTTAIHLAGAIGRPAWVMVPSHPEWRYRESGDDMPWYPSVTLIRQQEPGDWRPVIADVAQRLYSRLPAARIERDSAS